MTSVNKELPSCSHRSKEPAVVPRPVEQRGGFEKFCHVTSLHGWKFLTTEYKTSTLLKVIWIGVILGSIGVAVLFLTHSVLDFTGSSVQTTQDTSR